MAFRTTTVTGTYRDGSGNPVAGASVYAFLNSRGQIVQDTQDTSLIGSVSETVLTASDGTWSLPLVPPGDMSIAGLDWTVVLDAASDDPTSYITTSFVYSASPLALASILATATAPPSVNMSLTLRDGSGGALPNVGVSVSINQDSGVAGYTTRILASAPVFRGATDATGTIVSPVIASSLLDAGRYYIVTPDASNTPLYRNAPDGGGDWGDSANEALPSPVTGYAGTEDSIATSNPTATLVASPVKLTDDLKNLKYEDAQIVAGAVATMNPQIVFHGSPVTIKDTLEQMRAQAWVNSWHGPRPPMTLGPGRVFF